MKLLILGGTRFLGRHFVDAALAHGDQVTVLTRGNQPNPWGERVTALAGNRDPAVAPGLAALATGTWDAVVDTCGYVPRIVRASAELLAPRVGRYLFVSSISVYANLGVKGIDEAAPVASLDDPATEEVGSHYGALKAACERVVGDVFRERATIVRPGLIVGPYDPTDRFAYWPARFVHPALLGDRASEAVVPAPPEAPVQFVDARDLADWMRGLVANGTAGTFNATSPPGHWTWADVVGACAAAGGANAPRPAWTPERVLLDAKAEPWTGLPMWLPSTLEDAVGMADVDCTKAQHTGLAMRPLAAIVADTAAWLVARDNAVAWRNVLTAQAEREILAARARA
jgi:2'-hydroxyisoflavone reductase